MGQTVNLLAYAFGGSNPSLPTRNSYSPCCYSSAVEHFLGKEEVRVQVPVTAHKDVKADY